MPALFPASIRVDCTIYSATGLKSRTFVIFVSVFTKSDSSGNDLPSNYSPQSSSNPRIEIPEPALPLFSQDIGPDKESDPPPDDPPNLPRSELHLGDLPLNESFDPPDPPSIAESRQERRRKQRMKRKFKGTLASYIFVLVHRNREVAIAMAFHKKLFFWCTPVESV